MASLSKLIMPVLGHWLLRGAINKFLAVVPICGRSWIAGDPLDVRRPRTAGTWTTIQRGQRVDAVRDQSMHKLILLVQADI